MPPWKPLSRCGAPGRLMMVVRCHGAASTTFGFPKRALCVRVRFDLQLLPLDSEITGRVDLNTIDRLSDSPYLLIHRE